MRENSIRGIIWSVKPYQEKDALVTLLSREEGKMTLLAKGLRKEGSRRSGVIQPFSIIESTHTVPKHEGSLPILLTVECIGSCKSFEPLILAEYSLLAEISQRFLLDRHAVPGVFELWESFLMSERKKIREEIIGFLVQFFSRIGIFPDFRKCGTCGETFSKEKSLSWVPGGGVNCCGTSDFSAIPLSFTELKCFHFYRNSRIEDHSRLRLSPKDSLKLFLIIFRAIHAYSEKPFAARAVFEEIISQETVHALIQKHEVQS